MGYIHAKEYIKISALKLDTGKNGETTYMFSQDMDSDKKLLKAFEEKFLSIEALEEFIDYIESYLLDQNIGRPDLEALLLIFTKVQDNTNVYQLVTRFPDYSEIISLFNGLSRVLCSEKFNKTINLFVNFTDTHGVCSLFTKKINGKDLVELMIETAEPHEIIGDSRPGYMDCCEESRYISKSEIIGLKKDLREEISITLLASIAVLVDIGNIEKLLHLYRD